MAAAPQRVEIPPDAEYHVRLEVGPDHRLPAPDDHQGLLSYHLLDPQPDGRRPWLTWWRTKADYDRENQPLLAPAAVRAVDAGYVRQARVRKESWWRRVGPYNLFVYMVTVVTGVVSLYHFQAWAFQPPHLTVDVEREAPVLAAPFPIDLDLKLINHSAEVPARLHVSRVELKPHGAGGEPVVLSTIPADALAVPESGESTLSVRGEPVAPGRYAVVVHGEVRGGKLRREHWPDQAGVAPQLRVWPESAAMEMGAPEPLRVPGSASLSGWLLAGSGVPDVLTCSVRISGAGDFRFGAASPSPASQRKIGQVLKVVWKLEGLSPFDAKPVQLALTSPGATDWEDLRVAGGCS